MSIAPLQCTCFLRGHRRGGGGGGDGGGGLWPAERGLRVYGLSNQRQFSLAQEDAAALTPRPSSGVAPGAWRAPLLDGTDTWGAVAAAVSRQLALDNADGQFAGAFELRDDTTAAGRSLPLHAASALLGAGGARRQLLSRSERADRARRAASAVAAAVSAALDGGARVVVALGDYAPDVDALETAHAAAEIVGVPTRELISIASDGALRDPPADDAQLAVWRVGRQASGAAEEARRRAHSVASACLRARLPLVLCLGGGWEAIGGGALSAYTPRLRARPGDDGGGGAAAGADAERGEAEAQLSVLRAIALRLRAEPGRGRNT